MNKINQSVDLMSISEEACAWVIKLSDSSYTNQDVEELKKWMARSPKHRMELIESSRLWDSVDDMLREEILSPECANDNGNRIWSSIKKSAAIAATVALIFYSTQLFIQDTVISAPSFYTASIGEQKTVNLPDGSEVILNTDTQIEVLYSENLRNIRLIRGEALFDVAKNKDRPFQVYAGTGIVRAVGTAFAVHLRKSKVEVTVTEGRVELSSFVDAIEEVSSHVLESSQSLPLAILDAGQTAIFNETIEILEAVEPAVIEAKLAWKTGNLAFDGETLEEVIQDVGRYTDLEFVISDPSVRELKVVGYFQTNDIETLLIAIEFSLGIQADRSDNGIVYLSMVEE